VLLFFIILYGIQKYVINLICWASIIISLLVYMYQKSDLAGL